MMGFRFAGFFDSWLLFEDWEWESEDTRMELLLLESDTSTGISTYEIVLGIVHHYQPVHE